MNTLQGHRPIGGTHDARSSRLPAVLWALALIVAATLPGPAYAAPDDAVPNDQSQLQPLVNAGGTPLRFDWPMLRIGTAEYKEGPTGVTVFTFARPVLAAHDVRGEPATANTDWLRLGRDRPTVSAIVLSGGSFYGLESTTAVATAMKDDEVRSGALGDVAHVTGAIIYDLGDRRLNEIYPDKRLAQAAYRAAETGVFRVGSAGAGRMAMTGAIFGLNAHSGQGGAYYEKGNLKVAAFTVNNALGAVTNRKGQVAAGYFDPAWPKGMETATLLAATRDKWVQSPVRTAPSGNTTISLVVVNQKLNFGDLQRLAIQVHTSMSRGLQPYATEYDGDVLFAVSTGEVELPTDPKERQANVTLLPIIASELMWDAILSSVPEQPPLPTPIATKAPLPAKYAGTYRFSRFVAVDITAKDGKLFAQATGKRDAYDIGRAQAVELVPVAESLDKFTLAAQSRYPLVLDFSSGTLVINPGLWAQVSRRQ